MRDILVCEQCEVEALPYVVGDSSVPYLRCPNCLIIREPSEWKHKATGNEPMGMIHPSFRYDSHFTVVEQRRSNSSARRGNIIGDRRTKRYKAFEPTEDPIPLLAGQPDKDLEALLDKGILVALTDDSINEVEDTGNDDRYE